MKLKLKSISITDLSGTLNIPNISYQLIHGVIHIAQPYIFKLWGIATVPSYEPQYKTINVIKN